MEDFITFFSFENYNIRIVVLGSILLGISSSVIGTFSFLQKKVLIADVVAHSILPGVGLAFIATESKNILVLLLGAFVFGWISVLFVNFIINSSKIKSDTALAVTLTLFFSIGILIFSVIQASGNANQSGLDHFIFGKAAAMNQNDIYILSTVSIVMILLVVIFYKSFQITSFNKDYAKTIGLPVNFIEVLISTLTVLAIASGIQTVGAILMVALLVIPATAARYYTYDLKKMIVLAAFIGGFSGLFGSYISFMAPAMPTGPWMVISLSIVFFVSILFVPKRGIIAKIKLKQQNRYKVLTENILKAFYTVFEQRGGDIFQWITQDDILASRYFSKEETKRRVCYIRKEKLFDQ